MATITQTISSYNGGISQQPDQLKAPGQLTKAQNVYPDVTLGLVKRPGSRLIKSLSDDSTASKNSVTNGKWFHYYRDENEQYIGQIARDGSVKMWGCDDGLPRTVTYNSTATEAALKAYLEHYNDSDLQTLTLNDYTYITNRAEKKSDNSTTHPKTTVAMAALDSGDFNSDASNMNKNDVRPPEAFIQLNKVAYASQYSAYFYDSDSTTDVYTATRLSVTRPIDSSNSCKTDEPNKGQYFPSSGTLPGSTGWTEWCAPGQEKEDWWPDSFCPNVETRTFHVDNGDSGPSADANGVSHTYTVSASGGSASDRKNLYFRLSTTGQPMPEGDQGSPTYKCRYTTRIELLSGGQGWRTGDTFDLWMKNAKYTVKVEDHSKATIKANLALALPEPTPFDTETAITADSILGGLAAAISADWGAATVTQIGKGLYVTRSSGSFNVTSASGELMSVMTDSVNDVEDLPTQCKHGYVLRIKSSANNEDDYYVKFYGTGNRDGDGVWEECPKPGTQISYDKTTMPIQIVRQTDGSFEVNQVDWEVALVGDTAVGGTNPRASFVGKKISKILFFRNRLALLADEYVVLSRPGDFYNFWAKTALTFTPTDMIDISCSSDKPAVIYDGIQVNSGLVLFTKTQQFMLTTDSDVLSPQTAKINALANYNFNHQTNPISLGTTIGFLDNAGKNSRFWEVARVLREGEPDVIEQSKVVSKLFNKDLRLISNSKENQCIFFSEKNTGTIYCYKYYTVSNKRLQQAWFTWELPGSIQHHAVLDDALYIVLRNNSKDQLVRLDLLLHSDSMTVTDDLDTGDTSDDIIYRLHLDYATKQTVSSGYNATTDITTFTKPVGYEASTKQLVAYDITSGDDIGRYALATVNGGNLEIPGDWTTTFVLGYLFDMEIKFPTIYFTQSSGDTHKAEIRGSLVVHRLKLNLGNAGRYKTLIERTGKPDYTETWEPAKADFYNANQVDFTEEVVQTVPVYETNTNLTVTHKSTHPSPTTLFSMAWEGDYTTKFYRRV